jgi:hypothetical protein
VIDQGDFEEWITTSQRQDLVDSVEQQAARETKRKGTWPSGYKPRMIDGKMVHR